ncbi:hypothetical protein SO802_006366 [Lithocarpus litseifolius]|uniref:DUF4371 domain-containing protein n=1 Tax=Lithocarpus litseifolius TaxID=425828 RepID=A0AAW2DNW1_9ROSI
MIRILASYNDKVAQGDSACIASKVRSKIREDIGDSKFCIIVDESRDESKREQLALVLRFVDNDGFIQERFFDLSHVKDTAALPLKSDIYTILSRHCLDIQNICGQGYDGASNMCGKWKELQALVLNDCPYAYYVLCFAHWLQLALVAAPREVNPIHEFFLSLNFIITIVGSSCKRNNELRAAQAAEIARMLAIDELETRTGANQIGTLKRARFSKIFEIDIPNLSARFAESRSSKKRDHVTVEHHYHFDIFNASIDVQLQELDNWCGERPIELLTLCFALDPKDAYKSFNVDDICHLVEKYNPLDFSERDRTGLKIQLKLFEHDVQNHSKLQNLSSMAELCQRLVETEKSQVYPIIDRLIPCFDSSSVHSNW